MIWKNNNVMVRPMAVLLQTIRRSSSRKKKHNISFSFSVHFQKKTSSSKIKKTKNDQSFQRLAGPTPQKKECLEDDPFPLQLLHQTSPPHFFQGPHRNALGTRTTLLRTNASKTNNVFLWIETEKYQIHKEVFKKERTEKHVFNTDMGREMRISVNVRSLKKESWFYQAAEMCFMTLTEIPDAFALQNEGDCYSETRGWDIKSIRFSYMIIWSKWNSNS